MHWTRCGKCQTSTKYAKKHFKFEEYKVYVAGIKFKPFIVNEEIAGIQFIYKIILFFYIDFAIFSIIC